MASSARAQRRDRLGHAIRAMTLMWSLVLTAAALLDELDTDVLPPDAELLTGVFAKEQAQPTSHPLAHLHDRPRVKTTPHTLVFTPLCVQRVQTIARTMASAWKPSASATSATRVRTARTR